MRKIKKFFPFALFFNLYVIVQTSKRQVFKSSFNFMNNAIAMPRYASHERRSLNSDLALTRSFC